VLDHPRALQIGDFLQMSDSYGLPEYLRDEVFEVTAITTWQFEHEFETTFSLQSKNNDSIDLTIDGDAGRESASFSIEIPRATVEQLFDTDEFSSIFDEESPATLNTMAKLDIGDESQAVEIAVYAGGETEVSLVLHRSISDIRELWPAA
jgi:hypothetical protein